MERGRQRSAPVDPSSAAFISFITTAARGGCIPTSADDGRAVEIYGFPYVVVDGTQPKKTVQFELRRRERRRRSHHGQSFPFYPIPDEAITQAHWIEGGAPGNVDQRSRRPSPADRRPRQQAPLRAVQRVLLDGRRWRAGSGAFFDMKTNDRRPEGWTSADAAGLAILPGPRPLRRGLRRPARSAMPSA